MVQKTCENVFKITDYIICNILFFFYKNSPCSLNFSPKLKWKNGFLAADARFGLLGTHQCSVVEKNLMRRWKNKYTFAKGVFNTNL